MLLSIPSVFRQFKLSRLIMLLSLLIIIHMLITTISSTRRVGKAVRNAEQQSLISHVTSLGKVVATTPFEYQTLQELIYSARWDNDNSGYAFLADGITGRFIIYPPDPRKEGGKMVAINIVEGGTLEQAIVRSSQRGIAEMVHYHYFKPGMSEEILKAVYLYPLEQGGAVLLAGIYLDKSELIIHNLYKRISIPIVSFSILLLILTYYLKRRTNYLCTAMAHLAKGDFCRSSALKKQNELAFLADCLGISQKNLEQLANQQGEQGNDLSPVGSEAKNGSELEQLSKVMQEMLNCIDEVTTSATRLKHSAHTPDLHKQQNIQQCLQTIEQLTLNFDCHIQSLNDIKQAVISLDCGSEKKQNLQEKTNLVAFNAALESTKAGFNVVVNEIQELAYSTQETTQVLAEALKQINTTDNNSTTELNVTSSQKGLSRKKTSNIAFSMGQNIQQFNHKMMEASQTLDGLVSDNLLLKEKMILLDKQLSQFNFEHDAEFNQQESAIPIMLNDQR